MNIFTCSRTMVLIVVFLVLLVATTRTPSANSVRFAPDAAEITNAHSNVSNSTFYLLRPDLRRCASPMCGGYFVRRVNSVLTRCANGRQLSERYVARIDWRGMAEAKLKKAMDRDMNTPDTNDSNFTLTEQVIDLTRLNGAFLRGDIVSKGNRTGRYGAL